MNLVLVDEIEEQSLRIGFVKLKVSWATKLLGKKKMGLFVLVVKKIVREKRNTVCQKSSSPRYIFRR